MNQNFDTALTAVLKSEGGYVNDPRDSGGATNKGITQKTYDAWCDVSGHLKQDVRAITNDEVATIYKARYWDEVHGDDLPAGIDYLLFDYAVHSGPLRALKAYVSCKTIDDICDQRLDYLQTLRAWSVYANGWTNRIADVRATANKLAAATPQTPTQAVPASVAPISRPAAKTRHPATRRAGKRLLGVGREPLCPHACRKQAKPTINRRFEHVERSKNKHCQRHHARPARRRRCGWRMAGDCKYRASRNRSAAAHHCHDAA